MKPDVRTLTLRIDPDPNDPDDSVVSILVDGTDLVEGPLRDSFIGLDHATILTAPSPLLPETLARRVAVYRCNCGEVGCGCVAPIIRREGDRITWRDARDYTGVFVRPVYDGFIRTEGKRLPIPDVAFDAEQYETEVARASADHTWKSARRETVRLIGEYLRSQAERFRAIGMTPCGFAAAQAGHDAFEVSLKDAGGGLLMVRIDPPEGATDERARHVVEHLLSTPPEEWNVTFRGPHWFDPRRPPYPPQ